MKCFLGIDAGTSGIKVLILDEVGNIRGNGYSECDVITPHPGWAEQNPLDWWAACDKAVRQAVASCQCPEEIVGIGFSGQMQGVVCLDKNDEPIGNCIIWLDQRATAETQEIDSAFDIDEMLRLNASYCLNSYWAPKLLWLKKNAPKDYDKIYKVVFPKDYLRFRMTGEIAAEVSDCSMSYLLDVPGRKWADRMFRELDIPKNIVPKTLLESQSIAGYLRRDIAAEWGLKAGIPVIAGAGDQPANGVGTGIIEEGSIGVSIGTSGVVFGCSDKPLIIKERAATYSMCHAIPDKWCFLGLALSSGGSFKWLRNTVFEEYKDKYTSPYDEMTKLASSAEVGCEGLMFIPYLNGDKTPINDEKARGGWIGLSHRHGLAEMTRSVMEGVTYSLRDSIELMRNEGLKIKRVVTSGGGSKSELWRQIQADIFGCDIEIMNIEEGPAAGACILAGVGAGVFGSVKEGCDSILKIKEVIQPNPERVKLYNEYYESYRMLYPALKDFFARQSGIIARKK
ncbi:MAG: xylulokinase [Clostridia bacterium]|nr:xylulokinase [Clostridia bacterium]